MCYQGTCQVNSSEVIANQFKIVPKIMSRDIPRKYATVFPDRFCICDDMRRFVGKSNKDLPEFNKFWKVSYS